MSAQRRVKLFRNGRNQAVRIPREFELAGDEAIIRKEGDRLILEPAEARSLIAVLAKLEPLDEGIPAIRELPVDDVDF
ncbi:MAG: antitoxin [Longimicrobiales bacterium]